MTVCFPLLTYDTGQSTRARSAGLAVRKLTQPAKTEPSAIAQSGGNGNGNA
jgi:hypothetical protein